MRNDPNPGKSFAEFDRALDRTQYGPRWLGDTRVADMFVELKRCIMAQTSVAPINKLGVWVVMPNHVHLVLQPLDPLSEFIRWLKTAAAVRARKILELPPGSFWRREYYDHWIRSRVEADKHNRLHRAQSSKRGIRLGSRRLAVVQSKRTGGGDRRRYIEE